MSGRTLLTVTVGAAVAAVIATTIAKAIGAEVAVAIGTRMTGHALDPTVDQHEAGGEACARYELAAGEGIEGADGMISE